MRPSCDETCKKNYRKANAVVGIRVCHRNVIFNFGIFKNGL